MATGGNNDDVDLLVERIKHSLYLNGEMLTRDIKKCLEKHGAIDKSKLNRILYRTMMEENKDIIQTNVSPPKWKLKGSPTDEDDGPPGDGPGNKKVRDKCYKMSSKPLGRAIIINNENFEFMRKRNGTSNDAAKLYTLFTRIGFKVEKHNDVTGEAMKMLIADARRDECHKSADAFIVVVLSHGNDGIVFGVDGCTTKRDDGEITRINYLSIKTDILDQFDGYMCARLHGKPKIFIIQACQGGKQTIGCPIETDDPDDPDDPDDEDEDDDGGEYKIHEKADFLLFMSTVSNYKAHRSATKGSIFIQHLIKIFEENLENEDVLTMATSVNNAVNEYDGGKYGNKQAPEVKHSLRKKIFFSFIR